MKNKARQLLRSIVRGYKTDPAACARRDGIWPGSGGLYGAELVSEWKQLKGLVDRLAE